MRRMPLLLLSIALAATACGGGDDDTASAAPVVVVEGADDTAADDAGSGADDGAATTDDATSDAPTVDADATDEELALAFADCMRDEGIDFPDPTVAADGSVSLIPAGGAANLGFDPGSPEFESATDVCGPLIQGASFLPTNDQDITEIEDNLLLFAECLRDLGFDVADPDLSGGFNPASIFGENFDPTDPANADAIAECQSVFGAGGPLGGGE